MPIVGIGASAGGLRALQSFFDALPDDTGMAFVVITHLHPEHESHLAELLQKHTRMPTKQVNKKLKVERNHVYVMPPNRSMLMTDTHLDIAQFTEPHGQRTPIDHFFRSLASSHRESVGIILSGGGTDGAVGIKDIKELGGLLMVQHPDDAEYDSMPRAAINTGLADVVLPAFQLAEKLVDYIQHRPQLPPDVDQLSEQESETLQRILAQVHARTGHDFSQYKRSTILRRVERRMQLSGFNTLDAYLNYLRQNANEANSMFNDILIGVTNFFRDHESWLALQEKIIPKLFNEKDETDEIRIWSIGCATGEEAYSLAILLFEAAAKLEVRPHFQIFASDLDDNSIARAREGSYPAAIEADVNPERLERFFTREGEYYRVKRELRDVVLFANHNVLRDPPFSRQDLIACRNVLIYLQRDVQDRLFDIFHYALNPSGFLFLGSSETAEQLPDLFGVIDKTHRIYQARPELGDRAHVPTMPLSVRRSQHPGEVYGVLRPHLSRFLEEMPNLEEHHYKALESYGPPSVIINEHYMIVHVSETAGRYLLQPKGPITGDLLQLIRPEMQFDLRTLLFRALEKNQATISRSVSVRFNGHARRVVLAVYPRLQTSETDKGPEKQALVFFLEDQLEDKAEEEEIEVAKVHDEAERDKLIARLEAEVQRLREQLQVTIEEYDSSNEEMKAANEELQSINEEYRSATEELETSKEELQSVNEELQTVNNEMRSKLDEITRAHQELENLMGATEIPTLFLDRELRIQRYTAGMNDIFNMITGDRGRPIGHLTHKLKDYQFTEDAELVLRKLLPVEREVPTENDRWFLIRLRPYRTLDDKIEGVVISFIDITERRDAEKMLLQMNETLEERVLERTQELDEANRQISQARDLFYALFHSNPIPTSLTRLQDGLFIDANEAYVKYYGFEREGLIGFTSQELNLPLDHSIRSQLVEQVKKEGTLRNVELDISHPSGEQRTILALLQLTSIENSEALIMSFIDITERVRAEQQIRELASELTSAEQKERIRIAQVLHDDLQQRIFAIQMHLSFLKDAYEKNDLRAFEVDFPQMEEWLAESLQVTRRLSVDLSPPVLQGEGLREALIWLASQMQEQYNLNTTIESDETSVILEERVRVLLFSTVRELLFNIVKHAHTLEAKVALESLEDRMRIIVSDGGVGFKPEEILAYRKGGHGLFNVRHRLNLLGCSFQVESEPGNGTVVIIEAPYERPDN